MRVIGEREKEELIKQTIKMNKILIFSFTIELQCDSTLELHCSTIAIFFAIVSFYKFGCCGVLSFYAKFSLHMAYVILNMSALSLVNGLPFYA